jgi:hypothetical protein
MKMPLTKTIVLKAKSGLLDAGVADRVTLFPNSNVLAQPSMSLSVPGRLASKRRRKPRRLTLKIDPQVLQRKPPVTVPLPGPMTASANVGGSGASSSARDLRSLTERVRAGDSGAAEELRRTIDTIRSRGTVLRSAKPAAELDPAWGARVMALIDEIRSGVPAEWTEEELQDRIEQA